MHQRVYKGWGKETRAWWNIYIQEIDKETPLRTAVHRAKWGLIWGGTDSTNLSPCKRAACAEEWLTTPTKLSLGSESEREDQRGWWREPRWEDTQKKPGSTGKTETRASPEEAEVDAKGWEENKERMAVRAEAVEGELHHCGIKRHQHSRDKNPATAAARHPDTGTPGAWISVSFQLMGCMATPLSSDCEVKILFTVIPILILTRISHFLSDNLKII